jgi:hypothetical protein
MDEVDAPQCADTPVWTAQLAGERLIAGFRSTGTAPLGFIPTLGDLDYEARRRLLAWARARAGGESVGDLCRAFGWPRSSFERARSEALEVLASALARDKVPLT